MRIVTLVVVVALLFVGGSQAALVDRGGGLIYDTVLNVTWLQDANYAETTRYDADGAMRWTQATRWAENLTYYDSVRGITWTDWRLPRTPVPDQGVGINSSELGYMYFINLGNTAYIAGETAPSSWVFSNSGPFIHLQNDLYWSGTEYSAANAWCFDFYLGYQVDHVKDGPEFYGYAWAVRDGDVGAAPVPIPGAVWLLGSGLFALIGIKRIRG